MRAEITTVGQLVAALSAYTPQTMNAVGQATWNRRAGLRDRHPVIDDQIPSCNSTPTAGGLHHSRSITSCHHTNSTNVSGQYS